MRPLLVLTVLTGLGLLAALWLAGRGTRGVESPVEGRDEVVRTGLSFQAVTQTGDEASGEGLRDTQIRVLEGQVEYLQGQVKVLQEENAELLERLGTLGMKMEGGTRGDVGVEPVPADFVGLGIELMKLREIQALPIATMGVPAAEVEALILGWLRQVQPGDEGERFGRALHGLGWIPAAVDPLPMQAALLAQQLGGWYDAETQTLLVANEEPEELRGREVLGTAWAQVVREFGSRLFPKGRAGLTTDERLARAAVLAGDASLTRFLYSLQQPADSSVATLPTEDPDHPFNAIPLPQYLRELHFFPMNEGFEFMQAMHSVGGFAQMSAIYGRPPVSEAEVMDTERYLAETVLPPAAVSWSETAVAGRTPFWDDRLGQYALLAVLRMANEPDKAGLGVHGWAGDRLLAYAGVEGGRDEVVLQTLWQDGDWAAAFFKAMASTVRHLYQSEGLMEGEEALLLDHAGRVVRLEVNREGRGVLLIDAGTADFAKALHDRFISATQAVQ